jgi:hypothetical protein
MKKFSLFLIVILLISISSSFQQVTAQEKTKAEQEKEMQIQKAIEKQKKEMTGQKKALKEAEAALEDQQAAAMEDMIKDVEVNVEAVNDPMGRSGGNVRIYSPRGGSRSFQFDEPFVWSAPGVEGFYGHSTGGDSERTTWDFSKSVKENTFSRDYTFDVEKTVNTVVMSVMGDCKSGEIRIKIVMPNGKNYSDIVIDEFGNLNWRKSFTISETENLDKAGEWKFQIASTKATGFFKISLQTY